MAVASARDMGFSPGENGQATRGTSQRFLVLAGHYRNTMTVPAPGTVRFTRFVTLWPSTSSLS